VPDGEARRVNLLLSPGRRSPKLDAALYGQVSHRSHRLRGDLDKGTSAPRSQFKKDNLWGKEKAEVPNAYKGE